MKRRTQFSLIYLFAAVGLAALLFADIARGLRASWHQAAIVDAISAISGEVETIAGYEDRALYVLPFIQWEALQTPERAYMKDAAAAGKLDALLPQLSDLTWLTFHTTYGTDWPTDNARPIINAHLEVIEKLPKLERLELKEASITGTGLRQFHQGGNHSLKVLNLYGCTQLTSGGFENLNRFSQLETIRLIGCESLDDDVIQHFKQLKNIQHFYLAYNNISYDAAVELRDHFGDDVEIFWTEFADENSSDPVTL